MVVVAILVSGCEESVDPVLDTDEVFSLYGYLNPAADLQAVRVYAIDGLLEIGTADPLDAEVSSTNLRTGERLIWADSVITFRNESIGHVFYSEFRPDFDTPYELTAVRSDGKSSTVTVLTPPDGATYVDEVNSVRSSVLVTLNWSNIPRLLQAEITYVVKVPFPDGSDTTTVRVDIQSGRVKENVDGSWTVSILPSDDIGTIFSALLVRPGSNPIFLEEIEVKAFVVSEDWESPIGSFDPELLVQPGTFSNVEGGFGFVGGGYYDRFVFDLDDDVARDAGFSIK